jgi:hypothetical protein
MKWFTRFIIVNILLGSQVYAAPPEWVQETGRTIKGGDIVHWGMGEANSAELASFKARQSAIAAIIDECGGIANKAIIPRKQHIEPGEGIFTAYAHVSIDFQECDFAKTRLVKKAEVENPQIAEDQKLYRELIGVTPKKADLADRIAKMLESERIKTQRMIDSYKASNDQKLNQISEQLSDIQSKMTAQPAPRIIPSTSSQKAICQRQAQILLAQAQVAAADNYGNMAGLPIYNQLVAQQDLCRSMQ